VKKRTAKRSDDRRKLRAPSRKQEAAPVRLQKFLAHAGVASRRAAEELIRQGRVTVNGRVVIEMGVTVDPSRDTVKYDGQPVRTTGRKHYLILNKPRGVISTLSDPQGRRTVKDLLPPRQGRLYPVGRLDWDAEGVLLFTDDGELSHRLAHPRYGVERTYHVKLKGDVGEEVLARVRRGPRLEDGKTQPEGVRLVRRGKTSSWVTITLREGRTHEVKRIFLAVGQPVQKLLRVSFAGLQLGRLRPGECRTLTASEVEKLRLAGKE
jgi:23S rRNA pseudouridine2605 synthase